MPPDVSFAELMARLRRGDDAAATTVFRRFAGRLVQLARQQIDAGLQHKIDAEDVVQSAYRSFFTRYEAGQFQVDSWNELWGLLTLMTLRKCVNRIEFFQAQRRDAAREMPLARAEERVAHEIIDRSPTPLEAVILTETVEEVLRSVAENERPIIELSLRGYTAVEISATLGRAERTVRRVRERLRHRLEQAQNG